ncbi:hypothetical protein [Lewinella sp. IMCC34183]|uniref:hypothetical protein n=1 Tax=Lewinella sp. IMCC34183 TaxID=2248762 RepID=UPI000E226BB3|nr:hypothetical protein [Lewinella sp. IMCC34183]
MNYLTLKNDRKRRRQARVVTFVVTTLTLGAIAHGMGATQELMEFFQQVAGAHPVSDPIASAI